MAECEVVTMILGDAVSLAGQTTFFSLLLGRKNSSSNPTIVLTRQEAMSL